MARGRAVGVAAATVQAMDTANTPLTDFPDHTPATSAQAPALWRSMLALMKRNALPIGLSWSLLAGVAALAPSVGWMGKTVVDALDNTDVRLVEVLTGNGLVFGALFALLALLKVAEKPAGGWLEARIVVGLQRSYLRVGSAGHHTEDAAHMLYGTEEAKKGFKMALDEVPKLVFAVLGVTVWQAALAPGLLPYLAASVLLPLLVLSLLVGHVEHTSRQILDHQVGIAGATDPQQRDRLGHLQQRWVGGVVRLEALKGVGEEAMGFLLWAGFFAALLLGEWLSPGPGISMAPGDFVLAMVNLKLFVEPMSKIGKIAIHWKQARPALRRVLLGQHNAPLSPH